MFGGSVPGSVPVSVRHARYVRWIVVILLLVTLLWWVDISTLTYTTLTQQPQTFCSTQTHQEKRKQKPDIAFASANASASGVVISMAVCGLERFEQTVISLKSLFLQSHGTVARVYIIHDDDATKHRLMEQIEKWPIHNNNNNDNDNDNYMPPTPYPSVHFIDLQPIIKAASSSLSSCSNSSSTITTPSGTVYSCSLLSFIPTINLFRRCSTAKLMVPVLLGQLNESYVIHVDTDTAWMSPPTEFLQEFKHRTQYDKHIMIGLITETDVQNKHLNWYVDDCGHLAKPPYSPSPKGCDFSWYRPCGFNGGIVIYDISRLLSHSFYLFPESPRNSSNVDRNGNLLDDTDPNIDPNLNYSQFMISLLQRYEQKATLGDQDIYVIWFHRQPQYIHHIDPRWNWRFKHDMTKLTRGLGLIHFAGGALSNGESKYDMFRSAYHMYRDYPGWSTISSG